MIAKKLVAWFLIVLTLSINVESAASQRAAAADHLGIGGNDRVNAAWELAPATKGGGTGGWTERLGPDLSSSGFQPPVAKAQLHLPHGIQTGWTEALPAAVAGPGISHHAYLLRSGALTSFSTALPPPVQR